MGSPLGCGNIRGPLVVGEVHAQKKRTQTNTRQEIVHVRLLTYGQTAQLGQDRLNHVRQTVPLQDNRSVQHLMKEAILHRSYGREAICQAQLLFFKNNERGTK
jgi:hypothetical protein